MRRPSRPNRRSVAAFAIGAVAAIATSVAVWHPGASASAAADGRATCSASIDVVGGLTPESIFDSAFTVTSSHRYADDRSTGLRDDELSAALVGDEVDVTYVKDTGPTEAVRLEITVTFVGDRGVQSGRSVFSVAGAPDRIATYAVTCRR